MAKVLLGFGAMLGVALGLMLPAPSHGVHSQHLIVPGTSAR
ncbi:MAG TPA: hypothetical protein VE309_14545 [Caulobacteraceae bacterium]|nr:hypothetical protein [Caulobacteraceae bacterium]